MKNAIFGSLRWSNLELAICVEFHIIRSDTWMLRKTPADKKIRSAIDYLSIQNLHSKCICKVASPSRTFGKREIRNWTFWERSLSEMFAKEHTWRMDVDVRKSPMANDNWCKRFQYEFTKDDSQALPREESLLFEMNQKIFGHFPHQ